MKTVLLKAVISLGAIAAAGCIWLGLILLLRYSGISFLETMAVLLSHLSIFGWLLFLILVVVIYKLAVKNLLPRFTN
jgi:hypothetical protein